MRQEMLKTSKAFLYHGATDISDVVLKSKNKQNRRIQFVICYLFTVWLPGCLHLVTNPIYAIVSSINKQLQKTAIYQRVGKTQQDDFHTI